MVYQEDTPSEKALADPGTRSADALLVEQVRRGDDEASHRFFREFYPGIYRYLLWLTARPEAAEDLAQETFIRAWRHLDQFDDRGPLRAWLHTIAHREFLRSLRSQRAQTSLEEIAEVPEPRMAEFTEAVELRQVIQKLPVEEGEIVVLHYLHGYNCEEIARIVGAPSGTVKYRLSMARTHLQRELGEGDMTHLNEQPVTMRQWAWLPLDRMHALEARLRTVGREETDVIDSRLTRKVTLAFKATALSDLCEHLRTETGIHVVAGPSVADEKVTLFCEKMPLREVMRQLSRPFGYTWIRRGKEGEYRYELMQDLRSQLLEEELRNRDRNTALLVLEREIERYRPYLDLSPDEALARARNAPPEEKELLERLAGMGWGPIQMYFRLSPQEQAALRAGQTLTFSAERKPGEQHLPPDVARGVLQSFRDWRVQRLTDGRLAFGPLDLVGPGGAPATAVPEARAMVSVRIGQSELGQFTLGGQSGAFKAGIDLSSPDGFYTTLSQEPYAVGRSSLILKPDNAIANAKLARDRSLRAKITLRLSSDLSSNPARLTAPRIPVPGVDPRSSDQPPSPGYPAALPAASDGGAAGECRAGPRVTTADVLEALHRATGLPMVADFYTRLFPAAAAAGDQPLFDALNQLSDAMRLRWHKDGDWLQFRSASFYDDRIKEVPNRLLSRWTDWRREHGALRLDDLVEIAQLPDAQLDADEMAEGARECWGLAEWDFARIGNLRPHLRYLAGFTPAQRQEALSLTGLPFSQMPLAQQQQFIAHALPPDAGPLQSLEELAGATLRVEYTQPGWFQWGDPSMFHSWFSWVVPLEPGPTGRRMLRPRVRERTREAALEALRRLDPQVREAALHTVRETLEPRREAARQVPLEEQIYPTELGVTIIYIPGNSNQHPIRILHGQINNWQPTW